jgi:hypothetical protein
LHPRAIKQKRIPTRLSDIISHNPNVVPNGGFAIASEVKKLLDVLVEDFGCELGRRDADGRDDGENDG